MNRRLQSTQGRLRLPTSIGGAAAFHIALFACFAHEASVEPASSPTAAFLGVEVSLQLDPETSSAAKLEASVEPSDAMAPTQSAPVHRSAGPDAAAEILATDAAGSEEALDLAEGSLPGPFGASDLSGIRSAARRGVFRAPLAGSGTPFGVDQKARLAPSSTACADLFPFQAGVSRGEVTATLDVDSEGRAHLLRLERANPSAHGFEAAATACAERLRFEPARDAAGRTIASIAQVTLVFRRET